MKWATTKSRIAPTVLQEFLHMRQQSIGAQSTLWLSKSQAQLCYRLRCREGVTVNAELFERRTAFSLAEFDQSEKKRLVRLITPPSDHKRIWILTYTDTNCRKLHWLEASEEQQFEAQLYTPETNNITHTTQIIDAKVATPAKPTTALTILNAQETSNPFVVDETLKHTNLVTGKALENGVSNSLSTIWSQYAYTSLQWIPIEDVQKCKNIIPIPGQEPHTVYEYEPQYFVHLNQVNEQQKIQLLCTAPRWVIIRSLKKAVIHCGERWFTWRKMGLNEDLWARRGRVSGVYGGTPQHEIWVRCDHEFGYTGTPHRRHRVRRRLFYNSSQLVPEQH
ncbi:hypothetical protein ERJ75_000765000 [Trypanosoma vivax]|uniref:Uncharacterized protein n=1 Tax=Trypanosoma vivax (strain Y486) TaxID=1055687 RepID=G0U4Z5_TRYVY|nr:hypothetical protein ERJ75_000765000 [Trypanosoma vivax]CCC52510.1 conserved hypothetical protein [Trypanosoma vivax Y486]